MIKKEIKIVEGCREEVRKMGEEEEEEWGSREKIFLDEGKINSEKIEREEKGLIWRMIVEEEIEERRENNEDYEEEDEDGKKIFNVK